MRLLLMHCRRLVLVYCCLIAWPIASSAVEHVSQPGSTKNESSSVEEHSPTKEDAPEQKIDAPSIPIQKRPPLLTIIDTSPEDWFMDLDKLIVNQPMNTYQYVPLVQALQCSIDYAGILHSLYEASRGRFHQEHIISMNILWRKNIQSLCKVGYSHLRPATIRGQAAYTVKGVHGLLGLSYAIPSSASSKVALGIHHARGYFHCNASNVAMTSSWWGIHLASETQVFYPWLCLGVDLHARSLLRVQGASNVGGNYVVPGYGRNVQSVAFGASLYVQLAYSFLEKQFSFGAPRAH